MTVSPQPALVDDERAMTIVRTLNHLKRQYEAAVANFERISESHAAAAAAVEQARERYFDQQVSYATEFDINFAHLHAARDRRDAAS